MIWPENLRLRPSQFTYGDRLLLCFILGVLGGTAAALFFGDRLLQELILGAAGNMGPGRGRRVVGQRLLERLLTGKFPRELEELFQKREYGLFPSPKQIHFNCSCPDYAYMCKHVAAALYGIGARLDKNPLLFFTLRGADVQDLIRLSLEGRMEAMLKNAGKKTDRVVPEDEVQELFGI